MRRLRIEAERTGQVLSSDDVKFFEERKFYGGGLQKRDEEAVVGK